MNINSNQADVIVVLDGTPMFGGAPWATYAGGALTATSAKTRPGSMGKEVTNGGIATRADATLTIQWSDLVIMQFKAVENRVGKGRVGISANWLDGEGIAIPGAVIGRTGVLTGASDPDYDTNGNAVGMFTITCSLNEAGS